MLALGVNQDDLAGLPLSSKVTLKKGEHIAAYFEPLGVKSPFAGIGPADIHNRDPREFPLLAAGAQIIGDGVLGQSGKRERHFLSDASPGCSRAADSLT